MLAGNPYTQSYDDSLMSKAIGWNCLGGDIDPTRNPWLPPVDCPVGCDGRQAEPRRLSFRRLTTRMTHSQNGLRAEVMFGSCWSTSTAFVSLIVALERANRAPSVADLSLFPLRRRGRRVSQPSESLGVSRRCALRPRFFNSPVLTLSRRRSSERIGPLPRRLQDPHHHHLLRSHVLRGPVEGSVG